MHNDKELKNKPYKNGKVGINKHNSYAYIPNAPYNKNPTILAHKSLD